MEGLLKVIYELYTDYVLKNPFYEMEMPIRCELFDLNLSQAIQKDRVSLLGRWAKLSTLLSSGVRFPEKFPSEDVNIVYSSLLVIH